MPDFTGRDWKERAFTIGIGGPVGSGKTATLLALCKALREEYKCVQVLLLPDRSVRLTEV